MELGFLCGRGSWFVSLHSETLNPNVEARGWGLSLGSLQVLQVDGFTAKRLRGLTYFERMVHGPKSVSSCNFQR